MENNGVMNQMQDKYIHYHKGPSDEDIEELLNMENDKYYVPSIEEFHVGFEYEELTHERNESVGYIESEKEDWEWEKRIFGKNAIYNTDVNFEFKYQEYNDFYTRVKYLDKSDIESLGFEYIGNDKFIGKTKYYYTHIRASKFSDRVVVTIESSVKEDSVRTLVVHSISIKNKSELKKLLKQIGIDETS